MNTYQAGIDVGSTTVKLVVLDENGNMIFGQYLRHLSHTQRALSQLLCQAWDALGDCALALRATGSGAISLARALGIPFVQEVVAVAQALERAAPQVDVAIELGGEDAKIIYFGASLEERMNGVCAGGTGSFIDQMAALLQTDAAGLDREAAHYQQIYPIAARCGVFAKTDIQPLINEGATKADLAASIFQAVVNQTISGLACGKPIRGRVAFLGGPLHFLPQLKAAFIRTLKLTDETLVDPANSHLFAAMGAALDETPAEAQPLSALIGQLQNGVQMDFALKRLPPLFENEADLAAFRARHRAAVVPRGDLAGYQGDCFLGFDAGSTTTKLALVGERGELLWSFYANNQGSPIQAAMQAVHTLRTLLPAGARIARSCSTGYGEALLKSAFSLDEGEVETIAHCTAASFFDPQVDCVLDIGGQDMKCIKLKDGAVDTVLLNEACSSGCGSFLENFANSLGMTAQQFAQEALFAKAPVDLGTRCTVFMNSNVKQAQKEGALVPDISAGLACSVIKNALYKVIKLSDASELGAHIVVQGGTFFNEAVLRAFERISGAQVTCPDIAGIMGAFGAALLARQRYHGQASTMLPLENMEKLTYTTSAARCQGCQNHCMLTVSAFPGGRRHISGNRCEKALRGERSKAPGENLFAYKRERIFAYPPLEPENAPRGEIGIPRVLNMYENYPYWATFFRALGFRVILSPFSTRAIYELGMESIPSESECYPAKLAHGHAQWLIDRGVKTIFHPCVFFERQETPGAQNHYNCPIVVSYPENIRNNVEAVTNGSVQYLRPFLAFTSEKTAADRLVQFCREVWDIPEKETRRAARLAWDEQQRARADIRAAGAKALAAMEERGGSGIVLAGRPYHVDPEINHGIPELIAAYGLTVLTEDCLPIGFVPKRPVRVNDQWVYHSRLYTAAEFVCGRDDLELVQLNSFGCGLDAVTTDEVCELLESGGKLYTCLKIDEVNNLGAVRIRIRSLLAAVALRRERGIRSAALTAPYRRVHYTRPMQKAGYTILAPQMSPIHFDIIEPVFRRYGYNFEVLRNDDRAAIDMGLKFVNNDACFPSITVVGQFMEAVLSGRYDTDRLALIMSQTGGCCRASNYIAFIRRALQKAGLGHIPVISFNANGMETNEGFRLKPGMVVSGFKGVVLGDLLMRCLYRVRPYELSAGSADALHRKWRDLCIESLTAAHPKYSYAQLCRGIVADFDALPIDETLQKPRVGIVGEILVKYMPLANNDLVGQLEREGAEAVVPDLLDFFAATIYEQDYRHTHLGQSWRCSAGARLGVPLLERIRKPASDALRASRRFDAPCSIAHVAGLARPFLSIGNQYGEGWFLAGEMAELISTGTPNIVCIQPFACLPNHVVGKGVIKALRTAYPAANIVAVDYDPGASEVNQLNRIKLMLTAAQRAMRAQDMPSPLAGRDPSGTPHTLSAV